VAVDAAVARTSVGAMTPSRAGGSAMSDLWDDPSPPTRVRAPSSVTPASGGRDAPASAAIREDPPREWLVAAASTVAAGVLLLPLAVTPLHFLGYLLASMVTIALVSIFWAKDSKARTSPLYSSQPLLKPLAKMILLAGIAVAMAHLVLFALAVAR
jgi:hypothetical protein